MNKHLNSTFSLSGTNIFIIKRSLKYFYSQMKKKKKNYVNHSDILAINFIFLFFLFFYILS